MKRATALLLFALALLCGLSGLASAGGHVYQNGTDGGVGSAVSITASGVSVLVPARPGAYRYELTFQCTVAVNVAWGTVTFGPSNPAPTTSTGIAIPANTPWIEDPDGTILTLKQTTENWDRELDVISQSGSGTCTTYEATVN